MTRRIFVLTVALTVCSGCAEDELDGREAAYPDPVGITPPSASSPAPTAPLVPLSPEPTVGSDQDEPVADSEATSSLGEGEVAIGESDPPMPPDEADAYADTDPSALRDFRPALDPYGTWIDDPTYGTAWVPSADVVGDDFTPYVNAGHWAYDDDYTWISDYPWGWAPFHYGRWAYVRGPGWEWIPGRRYAGAWVSWRSGETGWPYVGWAPTPPTFGWRGGVAVSTGFVPRVPFAFIPTRDLFAPSPAGRLVTGVELAVVASHSRPVAGRGLRSGGFVARGPSLAALHIPASHVKHPAPTDRGWFQARAFARPSTAVALGAHGPELASGSRSEPVAWAARSPLTLGRAPDRGASGTSHFGGRFGGGFTGSPTSAHPPINASAPGASGGGEVRGAPAGTSFRAPPGSRGAPSAPAGRSWAAGASTGRGAPSGGGFHGGGTEGGSRAGGGFGGGRGGGHR